MIGFGAQVDSKTEIGSTALYIAAANGHIDIVEVEVTYKPLLIRFAQLLIKSGAYVNSKKHNGVTPLYIAAQKGHIDVAKV